MAYNSPEDRAGSGGVGSDGGSASMGTISPRVAAAARPPPPLFGGSWNRWETAEGKISNIWSWFHNTAPTMRCTTKFNTGGSGSGAYVLNGTEGTGRIERPHLYRVFRPQIQRRLATSAQHRGYQPPEGSHDADIQGPTGHRSSLRDLRSADAFRLRMRKADLRTRLKDGDEGKLFGFGLLLTYEDPYYNRSKYARCPFSRSLETPLSNTGWRILSKGIPPKRLPHLDGSTSALDHKTSLQLYKKPRIQHRLARGLSHTEIWDMSCMRIVIGGKDDDNDQARAGMRNAGPHGDAYDLTPDYLEGRLARGLRTSRTLSTAPTSS
ncbi:hypothetical protein V8E53_003805 [Lactarius tabidus]